jgi:hypothetical protein
MTQAEYEKVWAEIKARKERTSFPAAPARDVYEARGHHAESQAYRHG